MPVILTHTEMLVSQMVVFTWSTAGKSKCEHIVDILLLKCTSVQ